MSRTVVAVITTALASLAAILGQPATANAADTKYPVPYNFLISAVVGGVGSYGGMTDAPGSNDWTCEPSAAHPNPVVLVHGTAGNKVTNWQTYAPLLANEGYCVFALNYGMAPGQGDTFGGMNRIESSAQELADFIAQVRAATGASNVDLVGHSQGTLMPNYYVKYLGGAQYVDKYVSLSPLWHGTMTDAGLAKMSLAYGYDPVEQTPLCAACVQMTSTSAFIENMRTGGVQVPGVDYTNIVTRYDEVILPYTSGIEPGMKNIVLQDKCGIDFADHLSIVSSRTAADLVLNALDPAHPRALRCALNLPALGGL